MESNKNRMLFISLEYGDLIAGGLGRVLNGVTEEIRKVQDFDVLLLQQSELQKQFVFEVFEFRKGKKYRTKCQEDFTVSLANRLKKNDYSIVHILNTIPEVKECIDVIRKYSSHTRIIYSCHSILKFEDGVRRNFTSCLNCEEGILENTDIIHVLNNTSFKYLKKSYPRIASSKEIRIIPNGINETSFKNIDSRFLKRILHDLKPEKNKIVLCMSRWSYGKGLEQLIDAIPLVAQCRNDIQFVIAGRKPVSWEKDCAEYVKKIDEKIANISGNVIALGWMNDAQRNALYSISSLYVMPSYLEYFPYSILEPMIGGLPIVSSKIDCVQELLEEEKDCLLYDPYNPAELSRKILELINNEDLQNQFVNNCSRKVAEKYSWQKIAEAYLEMYSGVSTRCEQGKLVCMESNNDYL